MVINLKLFHVPQPKFMVSLGNSGLSLSISPEIHKRVSKLGSSHASKPQQTVLDLLLVNVGLNYDL